MHRPEIQMLSTNRGPGHRTLTLATIEVVALEVARLRSRTAVVVLVEVALIVGKVGVVVDLELVDLEIVDLEVARSRTSMRIVNYF